MTSKTFNSPSVILLLVLLCLHWFGGSAQAETSSPEFFTYPELVNLYEQAVLPAPLQSKLNLLLTTPFVDNSYRGNSPAAFSQSPPLGKYLRVAEWNIERGLQYDAIEAAFDSEEKFAALLDAKKFPAGSAKRREILAQAALLREADVIVLNEVDLGMRRTEYRRVAADLAARLKMNYAFGVEFVELSPVHLSQTPPVIDESDAAEKELSEITKVDPQKYKGLHGTAILSRFPLENVRLIPFQTKAYDWYHDEKNGVSLLEKGKRQLSKKIFLEETLREVRRGGRMMLLADIADERLPQGRVTIVATHLENKTKSSNRVKELEELLAAIKDSNHPVIVAGDMNTSSEDLTPTSLSRELKKRYGNPKFWLRRGISLLLGIDFLEDLVFDGITFWHNQADPTVKNIPLFARNPEEKFFSTLKKFRFADGGAFDFRGASLRSIGGKKNTLSDSNERGRKGFITTFQVNRPVAFIGRYKLDWFFIKPADLKKPDDRAGSYRFAPHFGRTLAAVNQAVEDRISDHRPMIVDLPLDEPSIEDKKR